MMNDFMLTTISVIFFFFLYDTIYPWSNAADQKIHSWKENQHQQETTLEQRPLLRKGNRDFIHNALFWHIDVGIWN